MRPIRYVVAYPYLPACLLDDDEEDDEDEDDEDEDDDDTNTIQDTTL